MLIARELRKTNIAEYILYMWQIEDSLRACSFDPVLIEKHLVSRFQADEITNLEIAAWYNNLAVMMEKEHVQEKGHLQVFINLVNDLNEFHLKMLEVQNDQEYVSLCAQNRETIIGLMQKTGFENEAEICFQTLYGYMMHKLKSEDVTAEDRKIVESLARQMGHLSARYLQFENDNFEL